jgi:hypothetical protein
MMTADVWIGIGLASLMWAGAFAIAWGAGLVSVANAHRHAVTVSKHGSIAYGVCEVCGDRVRVAFRSTWNPITMQPRRSKPALPDNPDTRS